MASRYEEGSLAPVDIYSSVINSWTQIHSRAPYSRRNKSIENLDGCVCQQLKKVVSLLDISIAATTGCEHCQIIFSSVMHFLPAKPEDFSPESWLNTVSIQQTKGGRLVQVICEKPAAVKVRLEIFTNEGEYLGCDAIGTASLVTEPLSTDFFDKIQEWAHECNMTHSCCIKSNLSFREHPLLLPNMSWWRLQTLHNMPPPLPVRVLDVGIDQNDPICLKETNGCKARYITLSHCWGNVKSLTLIKSTLECLKKGIPWSELLKTFQDAITITRGLQIRYIWIDSLCIVQDDDDDWLSESAKMATIYENSWLTIAATTAANGNEGCFPLSNSEARLRKSKQVREQSTNQQAIYARQLPEKGHQEPDEIAIGFSVSKPLMSRGWCFQERLLSRRVLHLCGEEMFWECSEHITCECKRTEYCTFKGSFDRVAVNEARDDVIVEMWDGVLSRYIIRDLTYQKDRLRAIVGVSEKFGKYRSALGNCVEGHWEGFLLASLLWFVSRDGLFFPKGRNTAHPSWSWASLDGSWSYVRVPIESRFPAKVLSTSWRSQPDSEPLPDSQVIKLQGHKLTQRLKRLLPLSRHSSWIKIEGWFRPAKLEYTSSHARDNSVHPFQAQNPTLLDLDTGVKFAEAWVDTVLDASAKPFKSGSTVYLLEIQEEDVMEHRGSRGLILTPVGRKNGDVFRRLGIYHSLVKHFENYGTRQITLL